jgi:HK97 family phage major capsid protein
MQSVLDSIESLRGELTATHGRAHVVLGRARSIMARAEGDKRELSPAENNELTKLLDQVEKLNDKADDLKAEIAALEATPQPRVTAPNPIASADPMQPRRSAAPANAYGRGGSNVLATYGADTGGFSDLGDFGRAVAMRDPRLFRNQTAPSGMQSGVGADGGFSIPPAFARDLMAAALEQEVMRPRCRTINMTTGNLILPRFDDANRSTGHAGLVGKATAEGATSVAQKAKLARLELNAVKLQVYVPVTSELLEDAGGAIFAGLLQDHLARGLASTIDDKLLQGSGAGEPMGLLNAPCGITVAKESGQANYSLEPANLSKMIARLAPGAYNRSVWIVHSSVLAVLFTLHQKVQNAAANDFVGGFAPGWFNAAPDGTMSLLGRPLVVTDRVPALGSAGDVTLFDPSAYIVGVVGGDIRLAVDSSVGFAEDEVVYKASIRIDGQPVRASAITPKVGTDTLSDVVKLGARS